MHIIISRTERTVSFFPERDNRPAPVPMNTSRSEIDAYNCLNMPFMGKVYIGHVNSDKNWLFQMPGAVFTIENLDKKAFSCVPTVEEFEKRFVEEWNNQFCKRTCLLKTFDWRKYDLVSYTKTIGCNIRIKKLHTPEPSSFLCGV